VPSRRILGAWSRLFFAALVVGCSSSGGEVAAGGGGASGSGSSGAAAAPSNGGSPGASGTGASTAGTLSGGSPATAGATSGGAGGAVTAGASATSGSGGTVNGGSASGGTASGGSAAGSVDAATLAAAMGFGANIGNTLENTTTWETGWGQPLITQAFIDGMASHGIKTVRVPVAWDTYATNGTIDATKLNRVKEVVGWIESAGMYAVVNIHWDGGWIYNESNSNKFKLTADVTTKFASYWAQIASGFADVGHQLVFEGLNEEGRFYQNGDSSQAPDYAALNQLNQSFVTTVRAQSGYNKTRALLIAGFATDIDLTCVDDFAVPSDPAGAGKLFVSLHYYTPYTFCGLDTVESWGSPATTWGTASEKAELQTQFSKLSAWSTKKKLPVILGEFGVTRGENYVRDPASRVLWMQSVAQAAKAGGMVPVLWDTGSEIQRKDGSFSTELTSVVDSLK